MRKLNNKTEILKPAKKSERNQHIYKRRLHKVNARAKEHMLEAKKKGHKANLKYVLNINGQKYTA